MNLKSSMIKVIYSNISRGLFEKHKLLFSLLIALEIDKSANNISQHELNIFLKGIDIKKKNSLFIETNPLINDIKEENWIKLHILAQEIDNFKDIINSIQLNDQLWFNFIYSKQPLQDIPIDFIDKLSLFQKLMLIQILCLNQLIFTLSDYIKQILGANIFENNSHNVLEQVYDDSDCYTPIIFILSTGADPRNLLYKLANSYNITVKSISLGQGQEKLAINLIKQCIKKGQWAFLQNCHLAKSFMPELESIILSLHHNNHSNNSVAVNNQQPNNSLSSSSNLLLSPHKNFRLWLTSMPASYFPVSILQRGIKLTNEPPKGIKANLLRSYSSIIDSDQFNSYNLSYKKLLYGLSFFFAIIQNRKKFGSLGWNKLYEFNDSDLITSITNTKLFITPQPQQQSNLADHNQQVQEQEKIPWDALLYICGEINFGGRVTDDWDRRCLLSNLKRFITPKILDINYKFSTSNIYYIPHDDINNLNTYVDYIHNLPSTTTAELFGMHENANIIFQIKNSQSILDDILTLQSSQSTTNDDHDDDHDQVNENNQDQIVSSICQSLLDNLPSYLDKTQASATTFVKK